MHLSKGALFGAVLSALAIVPVAAQHDLPKPKVVDQSSPEQSAAAVTGDLDAQIAGQLAAGPTTIWNNVFTQVQADHGKTIYTAKCQTCHGPTGRGGPGTPPVTGSALNSKWADATLLDYWNFAHMNMPPGAKGQAGSAQDYVDIVAYILDLHGADPGDVPLTVNEDQLANITIVRKPKG